MKITDYSQKPNAMPHQFSLVPQLRQEIETKDLEYAMLLAWSQLALVCLQRLQSATVSIKPDVILDELIDLAPDAVKGTGE